LPAVYLPTIDNTPLAMLNLSVAFVN